MENFDAIIIGTGQAGPSLSAKLAANGLKTAIIEKGPLGGTCVNNGCTPTKTMVASAKAAFNARRSKEYGVVIDGPIYVDMKQVKARKDLLVNKSNQGLEKWLDNTDNLTLIKGVARFSGDKTLEVGERQLQADKIFINVGGMPFIPQGFEQLEYLTNESIMNVDFIPQHLIIVGGSYIGLEFGQMFRRFGSQVTIIEKGERLIAREDPDISSEVLKILEEEGIRFRFNATCLGGQGKAGDLVVDVDCTQGHPQVSGSHVLLATGRQPNIQHLGLEKTGVETDDRGFIKVDDQLRTSVSGIWALGDCNGKGAFTHTAYNDFEIVAANLLENDPRLVSDRILCYALYIDPALARIGMTEEQVRESGRKALVATRSMDRIARAKEKGETKGFMKILVDEESSEILGAAILGIEGDEIIHSLLDVMYAKAPYTVIQRAVHIHPTVSELIPTTLADLKPLE